MKQRNMAVPGDAVRLSVQGLVTDSGRPLLLHVAGDTGLKVEPADGGSDIPRRITRKCRRGGVHLERNKLVHAPGTAADKTTAPAVAAPVAPGTAAHGGIEQTCTPPPDRGM